MIREIYDSDIGGEYTKLGKKHYRPGQVFLLDTGKAVAANFGKKCLLRRIAEGDFAEIEVLDCSDPSKYSLVLTGIDSKNGDHVYTYYNYVPFFHPNGQRDGYRKEPGVGESVTSNEPGYDLLDEELKKAEL